MKKLIYIILLFAILIRLFHITFPVCGWHAWRQADTGAIARNFYENGYNILYPQIDWRGNTPGYVESEFQLYPFLVSILYFLFGVNDMWGRILSVLFSIFTIYGLYKLTKKILSERVALWSAFIYAVIPLNIYYSRTFMPESMMLMCIVYGIYFFYLWVENESSKYLIYSGVFISLSILLKIPTLYIGLPLLYLAYSKYKSKIITNIRLWLYAIFVLLPVVLWYYHAHNLFLQTGLSFGIWGFGTDKWGNFELLITPAFYNQVFFMSIAERHLTYAGFIPFIIGLFIKRQYKYERIFDFWIIALLIYFLIVAAGNRQHEYYQLPFILPACVFAGKAFAKYFSVTKIKEFFLKNKIAYSFFALCFVLIFILSYLRFSNFMRSENYNSNLFKMANDVQSDSERKDLIITVCNADPIYLYRCDRKGWYSLPDWIDSSYLAQKKLEGAKLLIGEKSFIKTQLEQQKLNYAMSKYKVLKNEEGYFIVDLR